jgi:hypothetical protein
MNRDLITGILKLVIILIAAMLVMQSALAETRPSTEAEGQGLSLITATPEEGFALAIVLARKAVTTTQTNKDVLHALRPGYAHDAEALIAVSHVVAIHFQTIAAANDYWRE